MTVAELISILEEMDPGAEVVLAYQRNWPMESALRGVALRSDLERDDDEDDPDSHLAADASAVQRRREDGALNDVILVEGEHLRYGDKGAWEVAHRG